MDKQQQQEIRRLEILEAAKEIFSNTGYHAADVNEIAQLAKIAKGTVYLYFPSKKDLFLAVIEAGINSLKLQMRSTIKENTNPLEKIKSAIRTYMLFFKNDQKFYRLLVNPDLEIFEDVSEKFKDIKLAKLPQMADTINDGINKKLIRSIDAETLSYMILGMVDFVLFQWLSNPEKESIEQKINQVYDVLFKGILYE
jgi:AcrR family transcriptional regulator